MKKAAADEEDASETTEDRPESEESAAKTPSEETEEQKSEEAATDEETEEQKSAEQEKPSEVTENQPESEETVTETPDEKMKAEDRITEEILETIFQPAVEEQLEQEPEEPVIPAVYETDIDGIRFVLTASDETDPGDLPSIRKISDETIIAQIESDFLPHAGEGENIHVRHMLLVISGGSLTGSVTVQLEKAGMIRWKQEYGTGASPAACLIRYNVANTKTEKIKATIRPEEDVITFEAKGEFVFDYMLTAVTEAAEAETEQEETFQDAEEAEPVETPEEAESEPETVITESRTPFNQSAVVDGVRITVTAAEGVFPASSILSVERVDMALQQKIDQVMEQAIDESHRVAATYSFDIRILDENGQELQPPEGQSVNVSFSLMEVADVNLQTQVYHMAEQQNGTLNAEKLNTVETGQTISAESNGFSVYTITFSYEKRQFFLLTDTTIPVSEVLNTVGLIGTPTAVTLSGQEAGMGIVLEQRENIWILKAGSQSVSEAQILTITLHGINFEILVYVSEQKQETEPIDYVDENGQLQTWTGGYAEVQTSTWQATGGFGHWWAAFGELTLEQRVTVYGEVNLILGDGCMLKANGGIQVSQGSSLTIYSQGKKDGTLIAVSREPTSDQTATGAGIGGAYFTQGAGNAGKITINGGLITAQSGAPDCAGIGGGTDGTAVITISGGTIMATGKGKGAGIGGKAEGTTVTINGGTVTGTGGVDGGVDITGIEGSLAKYPGESPSDEGKKDPNKIYAPDGSVYTPDTSSPDKRSLSSYTPDTSSPGKRSLSSLPDSYTSQRLKYYESKKISIEKEKNSYKRKISVMQPVHTAKENNLIDGYNVILVRIQNSQANDEIWEQIRERGIVCSGFRTEIQSSSMESLLEAGLTGDSGNPVDSRTVNEILEIFGFTVKSDDAFNATKPDECADEQITILTTDWIISEGAALNKENKPFIISVRLNGIVSQSKYENGKAEIIPQPDNQKKADEGSWSNSKQTINQRSQDGTAKQRYSGNPTGISSSKQQPEKHGTITPGSQLTEIEKNEYVSDEKPSGSPAGPWQTASGNEKSSTSPTGPWETASGNENSSTSPAGPWETASGNEKSSTSPAGPWETASGNEKSSTSPAGPWETASGNENSSTSPAGPWKTASGNENSSTSPVGPWEDTSGTLFDNTSYSPWIESQKKQSVIDPAESNKVNLETQTDPSVDRTEDLESAEDCLDYLLSILYMQEELDRTVVIIIRADGDEIIILHPDYSEPTTITEEVTDRDILPTVLAVQAERDTQRQILLNALPGRNLLTLQRFRRTQFQ